MSLVVFLNVSEIKSKDALLSFASVIVSLSKTPNISKVFIWGAATHEVTRYIDRIPRSITITQSSHDHSFYTTIFKGLEGVSPQSMIAVIEDFSYMYLPESLVSCATAIESGLHYCQFVEILNDVPGIVSFSTKYWKAPSYTEAKSFMSRASTLSQDQDVFETYAKPFEILDIVKSRKIATPMPSLAAKLPLQNIPSLIPWQQVKQLIEQF